VKGILDGMKEEGMAHARHISFRQALLWVAGIALLALPQAPRADHAGPGHDADGSLAALVRGIVHAYGGKAVLEKNGSLTAKGVIESPLYEGPAEYSFFIRRDRRLRVETRSGSSSEVRILNGGRGYYRTDGSPLTGVSGPRFLSMVFQFKELTMPYQLMTAAFTITDGGGSTVQGAPARILMLRDKEGPPMTLYVDPKNHRIIKDAGVFSMGGVETELSSEFHDFRKVDGRLLPFRVVNYAGGQKVGEIRIREYQVNPELPDSLFAPGE
jgi:hypothetical protein